MATVSYYTPQAQAMIAYHTLVILNGSLADVLPYVGYLFLISLAFFLVAIMLTGIVSVGSIAAAVSFPTVIWIFDAAGIIEYSTLLKAVCLPVGLLIVFTHRSNIARLAKGAENRFPKLMLLRSGAARRRATESRADRTEPPASTGEDR